MKQNVKSLSRFRARSLTHALLPPAFVMLNLAGCGAELQDFPDETRDTQAVIDSDVGPTAEPNPDGGISQALSTCFAGNHDNGAGPCISDTSVPYCAKGFSPSAVATGVKPECLPNVMTFTGDETKDLNALRKNPKFKQITKSTTNSFDCFTLNYSNYPSNSQCPTTGKTVGKFSMMYTEVTLGMFNGCVFAGACANQKNKFTSSIHLPKESIDLVNLYKYCSWIGGRVPEKAEWEYAAKGGNNIRKYPWEQTVPAPGTIVGYNFPLYANYNNTLTYAVGSIPKGNVGGAKDGLRDMAGNIWEWTMSRDQPYFATDYFDVRGGSWISNSDTLVTTHSPSAHYLSIDAKFGGRCIIDLY